MEDLTPLIIIGLFAVMLVVERVRPARPLPRTKWWLGRGIVFFILFMAAGAVVPMLLAPILAPYALLDGSRLGVAGGALLAVVVLEIVSYWMHRTNHRFHFLWRWVHQMHHSAERIDVAGSVLFHPNELIVSAALSTTAIVVLGVSGESAAIAGLTIAFAAFFQHLNLRTPVWLGYIIQRPEGHSVHHQRGVHAYNYGNFAFSDMLFGTFRNPASFSQTAGFWDGASSRVGSMLVGRDVSA